MYAFHVVLTPLKVGSEETIEFRWLGMISDASLDGCRAERRGEAGHILYTMVVGVLLRPHGRWRLLESSLQLKKL